MKENITLGATAAQGSTITDTGCVTLDSMMKLPTFQQHQQPRAKNTNSVKRLECISAKRAGHKQAYILQSASIECFPS